MNRRPPGRSSVAAAIALLALGFTGCGFFGSSKPDHGRVAIVDLDRVAERTGINKQMQAALAQAKANLNQQLATLKSNLQKQLTEKVQDMLCLAGGRQRTGDRRPHLVTTDGSSHPGPRFSQPWW